MKIARKIAALIMAIVVIAGVFAGCSEDPVKVDFEKYLNNDMVEVNANYEKIKEELNKWDAIEDDSALADNIQNSILPLINDSFDKLSKIQPQTEEVKAVKAKYESVMNAYKEGFDAIFEAATTGDEEKITSGSAKIEEGVTILEEYNKALEDLAATFDMEIEY